MKAEELKSALEAFDNLCDAFDSWLLSHEASGGRTTEHDLLEVEPEFLHCLADAARERLAQLESNAMLEKVWWCVVTRQRSDPQRCLILAVLDKQHHGCGEKQLAPIDALVVVKENGEWPEWTERLDVVPEVDDHGCSFVVVSEVLDALQAAQSGGE